MTVKDMLTTRMRLAYLNSEAAKQAIPRVADLMAKELGWSKKQRDAQVKMARDYIGEFGGPVADKSAATLRAATFTDLHDIFLSVDKANAGGPRRAAHASFSWERVSFPRRTPGTSTRSSSERRPPSWASPSAATSTGG